MGETYFCGDFVAEQPACSPGRDGPSLDIIGVAPDQVAKRAFVRNLLGPCDNTDLIQGADLWTQSAVHTEDLSVDDRSQSQKIKDLAAGFPDGGVAILLLTLLVETVDMRDLPRFVISAYEGDSVGIPGLVVSNGYVLNHAYLVPTLP